MKFTTSIGFFTWLNNSKNLIIWKPNGYCMNWRSGKWILYELEISKMDTV